MADPFPWSAAEHILRLARRVGRPVGYVRSAQDGGSSGEEEAMVTGISGKIHRRGRPSTPAGQHQACLGPRRCHMSIAGIEWDTQGGGGDRVIGCGAPVFVPSWEWFEPRGTGKSACATEGLTSLNPTPIWDELGCGGIPREGWGI